MKFATVVLAALVSASAILTVAEARCHKDEVNRRFTAMDIIPGLIATPKSNLGLLRVSYPSGDLELGKNMTIEQVSVKPGVSFDADPDAYYTVMLLDAGNKETYGSLQILVGLVANIPGSDFIGGDVRFQYRSPTPAEGTGLHTYVFLLFQQSGKITFDGETITNISNEGRDNFNYIDYVQKYSLIRLVAANCFFIQAPSA